MTAKLHADRERHASDMRLTEATKGALTQHISSVQRCFALGRYLDLQARKETERRNVVNSIAIRILSDIRRSSWIYFVYLTKFEFSFYDANNKINSY